MNLLFWAYCGLLHHDKSVWWSRGAHCTVAEKQREELLSSQYLSAISLHFSRFHPLRFGWAPNLFHRDQVFRIADDTEANKREQLSDAKGSKDEASKD